MALDIGIVARRSGMAVSAIRYYEDEGLLGQIDRGANGRRQYGAEQLNRLIFIRQCRETGMPLGTIAELLVLTAAARQPCPEARGIVEAHLAGLRAQIARMQAFAAKLDAFASACEPSRCGPQAGQCTIFSGLAGESV